MGKGTSKGGAKPAVGAPAKPVGGFALASGWPVYEVLLSHGWAEEGALTSLLIARRSPISGRVACAHLLVDLGCLGVKSAQVSQFKDVGEYQRGIRAHAMRLQPMQPASLNLAAKIVGAGLEYAARLGFRPDPVYAQAAHLLAGADPAAEMTAVPTGGSNGKPFYINGPHDDARKIIAQLMRAVGPGNFDYVIQGSASELGLPDIIDEQGRDAT